MSQNTSIREGGQGRAFGPVRALLVQGDGGKYYLWVPESERQLGTKSIDKNGTYTAASDGVYGWSSVTVNVPTDSSVVGRDPDTGEEVIVKPDPETGDITKTVLPVEIRVITPPDNPYGVYVDGQTIGKTGMVVKAYTATGAEWGVVPNGEITLHPNRAVFDSSTEKIRLYGDGIEVNGTQGGVQYRYAGARYVYMGVWGAASRPATPADNPEPEYPTVLKVQLNDAVLYLTEYNNTLYAATDQPFSGLSIGSIGESYGVNVNFKNTFTALAISDEYVYYVLQQISSPSTSDPSGINIGDLERERYGTQTITVSWPRVGDGAVLEATFDIRVGPHGGTGEG